MPCVVTWGKRRGQREGGPGGGGGGGKGRRGHPPSVNGRRTASNCLLGRNAQSNYTAELSLNYTIYN